MRISDLSSGQDINKLKQLLASGVITNDDLNNANISGSFGPVQGTQNALTSLADPGPQNDPTIGSAMGLGHELYRGPNETDAPLAPQEKLIQDALAAQQGDQNALSRVQNAMKQGVSADKYGELPQGNNFVKNEQTGQVIYLGPNGQQSPSPSFGSTIGYSGGGAPPGGSAYTGSTRMMPQKQQDGPPVTRVLGSGAGTTVDLGGAGQNESVRPPLASGRNPIDIPGAGRGYYGTDGNAYVPNGDGSWTKVLLGYDMQGSMALNKANLDIAKTQADIAHTQEQIRASKANNPDFSSGPTGAAVAAGITGPDLLKTIDPGTAATVQAMLDGRMQPPGQMALRNSRVLQLINLANQVDPTFDATTWVNRYKTAQDFSSGGKSGQTLTAFNTALEHLARLQQSGAALNNSSFPMWNTVANTFEQNIGDPRIKQFQADKDALTGELTKAFNSGHITDAQLAKWGATIDASNSPQQLEAAYKEFVGLLGSKMNELGNSYERGMGKSLDRSKFMSPEATKVYQQLSGQALPGITTPGSGQVQQVPQTFSALPDPKSNAGRTVKDTQSGARYKSDGTRWVRIV